MLVATLYSRREAWVSELSRRFTFRAMARFARDPRAPPGLSMMEAWSPLDRTSQTMGPMWPCRTRKILLGFLQNSVGDSRNGHVLVLRRGMPAAELEHRDVREVVSEDYPAVIGYEAGEDGSALSPFEYVTTSVFPADEGFIVLPVPPSNMQDIRSDYEYDMWKKEMAETIAEMVLTYVAEVESP